MNGLASFSPHESVSVCHANTLFEHMLFLVIPGGSCVYGCQPYVVSSFLIPRVINLAACRHGNSAYLKEETVFITLFAVLVLVSLLMVWEPYSVIEHVEGGMPFFLNITNNTGRHFMRWYLFSCTQYSLICLQCHYLALNCLRYCNTRI